MGKDQQWGGRSSNSIIKLKVKSLKGNLKEFAKVNSIPPIIHYFMRAMSFRMPYLCKNIASETVCPFISIMKTYDIHKVSNIKKNESCELLFFEKGEHILYFLGILLVFLDGCVRNIA